MENVENYLLQLLQTSVSDSRTWNYGGYWLFFAEANRLNQFKGFSSAKEETRLSKGDEGERPSDTTEQVRAIKASTSASSERKPFYPPGSK